MQNEVGKIVEGKVTGITKFGAFVELEGGEVGMVHISEVSQTYVNEISEHLKEQQKVKVKILGVDEKGKISLSIKKALPPIESPKRDNRPSQHNNQRNNFQPRQNNNNRQFNNSKSQANQSKNPANFEDMLSKFMSSSEEKFSDLKKPASTRRGNNSKKHTRDYD